MKTIKYKDLRLNYFKGRDTWSERFIIQIFSLPLIWVILKINQSKKLPYILTFIALILNIAGAVLIFKEKYVFAALFIFFAIIIDHIDGVAARFIYGKDPDIRGTLDFSLDYLGFFFINFSLFYAFYVEGMHIAMFLFIFYILLWLLSTSQMSTRWRLLSIYRLKPHEARNTVYSQFNSGLKGKIFKFYKKMHIITESKGTIPYPTINDTTFLIFFVMVFMSLNYAVIILLISCMFVIIEMLIATIVPNLSMLRQYGKFSGYSASNEQ